MYLQVFLNYWHFIIAIYFQTDLYNCYIRPIWLANTRIICLNKLRPLPFKFFVIIYHHLISFDVKFSFTATIGKSSIRCNRPRITWLYLDYAVDTAIINSIRIKEWLQFKLFQLNRIRLWKTRGCLLEPSLGLQLVELSFYW